MGAPGAAALGTTGAAYVYRASALYVLEERLTNGTSKAFGEDVAIGRFDGVPYVLANTASREEVLTFRREQGGTWLLDRIETCPTCPPRVVFARSVAAADGVHAIGAFGDSGWGVSARVLVIADRRPPGGPARASSGALPR